VVASTPGFRLEPVGWRAVAVVGDSADIRILAVEDHVVGSITRSTPMVADVALQRSADTWSMVSWTATPGADAVSAFGAPTEGFACGS
jgi:hypothetical protein